MLHYLCLRDLWKHFRKRLHRLNLLNNPPDVFVEISKKTCGTFDFFKAEELVEIGRLATQEKFVLIEK